MPNKIKVPMQALEVQDANGQSVTPEVGDEVEFVVQGNVETNSDGIITVMPTKYNEVPYEKDMMPKKKKDQSMDEEFEGMLKEAHEMDSSNQGGNPRAIVY